MSEEFRETGLDRDDAARGPKTPWRAPALTVVDLAEAEKPDGGPDAYIGPS